jgi:hypothetical protein
MSYTLDPELVPAMAALAAQAAGATPPARGDWQAVRAAATAGLAYMASITPPSSGVTKTSFSTPAGDGQGEIELRWYTTAETEPGPAVVYAHGGGMLGGSVGFYDQVVSWYAAQSGVPFLSVGSHTRKVRQRTGHRRPYRPRMGSLRQPSELCLQARNNRVAPEVCQSVSERVRGSPKRVMTLGVNPVMAVM